MPSPPSSSETPKCILVNPATMGSLSLDEHQIRMIILGLIELAEFKETHISQVTADLADTIHKHVFGDNLTKINQRETYSAYLRRS